MSTILPLALGAALGAAGRHYVSLWAATRYGAGFPIATLLVNVAGSFLLGLFLVLAASRTEMSPGVRLFVATGFCGSLTTFSTFSYESYSLLERGEVGFAALNLFGSLAAGLLAVLLGVAVARLFVAQA